MFFISFCLIKSEPKVPFEAQTPNLFTCIVITSENPRFLFWTVGVVVYHKTHLQSFIIVFLITLMQVHLLLILPRAAKHNKYSACLGLMCNSASQPANIALEQWFFSRRVCVYTPDAQSLMKKSALCNLSHVYHVVFDVLISEREKKGPQIAVRVFLTQLVSLGEGGASLILPPSEEEERPAELRSESVCLCLYMWPIVVCSDELGMRHFVP